MSYKEKEEEQKKATCSCEIYLRNGKALHSEGPIGPKVGTDGTVYFKGYERNLLIPLDNVSYIEIYYES